LNPPDQTLPQTKGAPEIRFLRLPEIALDEIAEHMSDPRVVEHMPLATDVWDRSRCERFVTSKEDFWRRDGLGHWAILCDGVYAGWGGLQKESGEWDFGLVLKPDHFGLGTRIARKVLAFARSDIRIPFVTFLLPLSRKHFRWLDRLGAECVGEVEYAGSIFRKYRLGTE
tara:strand:- start:277 stop:786 length:510 start_codon:yes stop_codon:yes gene_type:complete